MSKLIHLDRQLKAGDMVCIFRPSQLIMLLTDQNAQNFNQLLSNAVNMNINIDSFAKNDDIWLIEPALPNIQAGQSYRLAPVMNGLQIGDAIFNNQTRDFTFVNELNIKELTQTQADNYNRGVATLVVLPYKSMEEYAKEFNDQIIQRRQQVANQFNPFGNR